MNAPEAKRVADPTARSPGISLHDFLTRLIWLSVLPLLLLAVWLAFDSVRTNQAQRDLEAENAVKNFAVTIDNNLRARISALKMLSLSPELADRSRWNVLYQNAQAFNRSFGSHVILADAAGLMIFNTRVPFGSSLPALPKPAGRAAVPVAMATGQPAVGDVFYGPLAKEALVAIAVPVDGEGSPELLLLSIFETRQFQGRIDQITLPADWSLSLLDSSGAVIARRGQGRGVDVETARRFVATPSVTPWSVVLEIPASVHRAPLITAAVTMAVALLIATLVSILGSKLASRRLARAVASLVDARMPRAASSDIQEIGAVRRLLEATDEQRVMAEATLVESEVRFQAMFEQAGVGIALVALDGRWLRVNGKLCAILGYSQDELLTLTFQEITHADDRDADLACVRRMLAREIETYAMEKRYVHKDGHSVWTNLTVALIWKVDGTPDYFVSVVEDIQARKEAEGALAASQAAMTEERERARLTAISQMEEAVAARERAESASAALRASEERFRVTFEQAAVGIALVSIKGDWLSANKTLCEIVGYSADELLRTTIPGVAYPDDFAATLDCVRQLLEGDADAFTQETRFLHKDGRAIWINLTAAVVRDAGGAPDYFITVIEDIQRRKEAEAAVQSRELALREAQRLASIGNWAWDVAGDRHLWSEEVFTIYGRDSSLPPAVYPEVQQYFTPESWAGLADVVALCLADGTPYTYDAEVVRADGAHRWVVARGAATRDADGKVVELHGTVQDITARKHAEEEILRLNADLEKRVEQRTAELSAANRELESFAYAVSHDLRAPLRAMSGFSQALIEDYGDTLKGNAEVYLEQIGIASHKMRELIEGILALSRTTRGELQRNEINLSVLAAGIVEDLARSDPGRTVATVIEPGLVVNGDARMIEAMMRNLLDNAWKYTAATAAPLIRIYAGDLDGRPGICVADNGAGFDMAHAGQLFQPFRRLHRQDEFPGLGIGLATVQRIVHRHGGAVRGCAAPGKGATFCFTLAGTNEAGQ